MAHQECALYGDLVLWLRDQAAGLLAGEEGNVEAEQERLDALIREWFITPQEELCGCAPREIIWAERAGRPNPIDPDQIDGMFPDDCPICEMERRELEASLAAGEEPALCWHYDDGGYPLIARYDPEAWERQASEGRTDPDPGQGKGKSAEFDPWQAVQKVSLPDPEDRLPSFDPRALSPKIYAGLVLAPWIDPPLYHAADRIMALCTVPLPDPFGGMRYRRLGRREAVSLVAGFQWHGANVDSLLGTMEAWAKEKVPLDWLGEPVRHASILCRMLDPNPIEQDKATEQRLRHNRDFLFILASAVPSAAQLWLQGWLRALALGEDGEHSFW